MKAKTGTKRAKRPKRAKRKTSGRPMYHDPAHVHGGAPRFEFALAQPFNMAHGLIHTAEDLLDAITDPMLALSNTTALRALLRDLAKGIVVHATTVYAMCMSPRAFGRDIEYARSCETASRINAARWFDVPADVLASLDAGPTNGKITAAEKSAIRAGAEHAARNGIEYVSKLKAAIEKERAAVKPRKRAAK